MVPSEYFSYQASFWNLALLSRCGTWSMESNYLISAVKYSFKLTSFPNIVNRVHHEHSHSPFRGSGYPHPWSNCSTTRLFRVYPRFIFLIFVFAISIHTPVSWVIKQLGIKANPLSNNSIWSIQLYYPLDFCPTPVYIHLN